MRETIVLAPGLMNVEIAQSLAFHGINTFQIRFCNAAELARLALTRAGISLRREILDSREEIALAARAVRDEDYFSRVSYTDIQSIAGALRKMRCLVTEADEQGAISASLSQGTFTRKNAALLHVYQKYMKLLAEKGALDAVGLIRIATIECRPLDSNFVILEEFPLNPLEQQLLQVLSGDHFTKSSVGDLFQVKAKNPHISDYKKCYGAPNEVESLLSDLYAGEQLDRSVAAVTNPAVYSQLFFDYALLYDIPITFGCGIPVSNSNPAKLLSLYYRWMTSGFYGAEALLEMLRSSSFDMSVLTGQFPEQDNFSRSVFYEVLGALRLTNDKSVNAARLETFKKAVKEEAALSGGEGTKDYKMIQWKLRSIPCLEIMAEELALPAEDFVRKYAYIRRGSNSNADRLLMALDQSSLNMICEELKVIRAAGIEQTEEDLIPNILKRNVCRQGSEEGKLHVTEIRGAFSTIRDNLYIVGLSASNYPGSPREDYLLLDEDLHHFCQGAGIFLAEEKIRRKRRDLLSLAGLISGLGCRLFISYAGLNVSELKKDNASSLLFELYRGEHGENASASEMESRIREIGYFMPAITATRMIGQAYNGELTVMPDEEAAPGDKEKGDCPDENTLSLPDSNARLEREYSVSALDTFSKCPKKFMLRYIMGIPEPDTADVFAVMTPIDTGNLAHALMQRLGNSSMSQDEFMVLSNEYFERFIAEKPPLVTEKIPAARDEFLEMMETAYRTDPHREVILEEEELHYTHENRIRIRGIPDRVEKLQDGSCLIVDFKSGRNITHLQDDPGTCMQALLYACMMEKKGLTVKAGEYRYLREGAVVTCRYDKGMREHISGLLDQFRDALTNSVYPLPDGAGPDSDTCKYCKYMDICGAAAEDTESEEEG
ncbi:MAG: PD-(D/E)XK nuclease family protein [Sarcina sp.]|nr:PD-(D/E)XK nuclease family protein [Sarcina sp.]